MDYVALGKAVERFQQGEAAAFEEIYQQTYRPVFFHAMQLLHRQEDAEDAVAETYIQAFKGMGKIREPKSAMAWLNTTVSRVAMGMLPDKGRQPELSLDDEDSFFEPAADWKDQPESVLDEQGDKEILSRIIQELPDEQRMAVILFYYDEQPVAKIAELMNCSENTVKSRLSYARKKIEAGLRAEEKRTGVKLYSASPLAIAAAVRHMIEAAAVTKEAATAVGLAVAGACGYGAAATAAAGGAAALGTFFLAHGKLLAAGLAALLTIGAATGVVLHKASGKTPEPEPAIEAVAEIPEEEAEAEEEERIQGALPGIVRIVVDEEEPALLHAEIEDLPEDAGEISYQWLRAEEPIPDAVEAEYLADPELDDGEQLRVEIRSSHYTKPLRSEPVELRFDGEELKVLAEGDLDPNEDILTSEYFPDPGMLDCLRNQFPNGLTRGEAAQVTELYIGPYNIIVKDLTGIEYFPSLTYLRIVHSAPEKIDLRNNAHLETINMYGVDCPSLDVSYLKRLETIELEFCSIPTVNANCGSLRSFTDHDGGLKTLQIDANSHLEKVSVYGNELTRLNLPKSCPLQTLLCGDNNLTELDVSAYPTLESLNCFFNPFTQLDLHANTRLTSLGCGGGGLTALDVSMLPNLEELTCFHVNSLKLPSGGALSFLNVCDVNQDRLELSGYNALREVYIDSCSFNVLCVYNCGALDKLSINSDPGSGHVSQISYFDLRNCPALKSLDLSSCYGLTELTVMDCGLNSLNLSGCSSLKGVIVNHVSLGSLSLPSLPTLTYLDCNYCGLSSIDVSGAPALETLTCVGNPLGTLTLPGLPALRQLTCPRCSLTYLDVSGAPALQKLECQVNNLATLELSANGNLHSLFAENQTRTLTAVQVIEDSGESVPDLPAEDGETAESEPEPAPSAESTTWWVYNLSELVGGNLGRVLSVNISGSYAYDPSTGELRFEGSKPDSFTYTYDTGSAAGNLTVTVILN